jgi:pseudouridine-5'-monophosphatase
VALPPTHVIFDLDGTLVDTEPLYTEAAQRIVQRFGKVFDLGIKRQIMGGGPLSGARFVVEHLGLPLTPEAYLSEREAWLRQACKTARPMPGAVALVEALHARGIPLAIGTSSERELCQIKLSAQPFANRFASIACSDDPGVLGAKPAPDIFLCAARSLGADPARCLVFEDSPKGVMAARAAGMEVIAVVDPTMAHEDYAGALSVLSSLEELRLADIGLEP